MRRPVMILLCVLALLAALLAVFLCTRQGEQPAPPAGSLLDAGWNCAWYVYWDSDVADELKALQDDADSICLFAGYFDDEANVYMPEAMARDRALLAELQAPMVYVSFTNDVQHADGTATQKDVQLLTKLWSDRARMEATADALLDTVRDMDAGGIEIDFENIKDDETWTSYGSFLQVLADKAEESGAAVRVVLPVTAPVDTLALPENAEYTVMCYNLHGLGSSPGPKADAAFLKKTAEKFSVLPHAVYALATGGFEWDGDGRGVRSLTQAQAETLAAENDAKTKRDGGSGALYFTYRDGDEKHTVWYADAQTLADWRGVILQTDADAGFDLWRVGGNTWA